MNMQRPFAVATLALLAGGAVSLAEPPFPAEIHLADIGPNLGLTFSGTANYEVVAWKVAAAGDINGDGLDDVMISSQGASPLGRFGVGAVYVIFGADDFLTSAPTTPDEIDGDNGFVIAGPADEDGFGHSIDALGDVNGDGCDDVIIGAPYGGAPEGLPGTSFVIFGHSMIGESGVVDAGALDGSDGFRIEPITARNGDGWVVAGAGDLNNDNLNDIVLGSSATMFSDRECYVIFGNPDLGAKGSFQLSDIDETSGVTLRRDSVPAELEVGELGYCVMGVGDINADGIDDVALVDRVDGGSDFVTGQIVFGSPTLGSEGPIDVGLLDGEDGFTISGLHGGLWSRSCIARPGDLNSDGVNDLVIGSPTFSTDEMYDDDDTGKTHVIFGGSGIGAGGLVSADSINGANGLEIVGALELDLAGSATSVIGDINADGFQDLLIGAQGAARGEFDSSRDGAGESYVVFGGPGIGVFHDARLDDLVGDGAFKLIGVEARETGSTGDHSGWSVAPAGDLNNDGVRDFIIGAPFTWVDDVYLTGQAYIIFGRNVTRIGDLDDDNLVNTDDLAQLLSLWGPCDAELPCPADLDNSGAVAALDIAILLSHWTN